MSILMEFAINTEGKPDVISNKRKLMRWIGKCYEDITGDEEGFEDSKGKVKYI